MKSVLVILFLQFMLFSPLIGCHPTFAAAPVLQSRHGVPSYAPMLKTVLPAVVNISSRSNSQQERSADIASEQDNFGLPEKWNNRTKQSLGSGVIIDASKGYIITNYHVVYESEKISVTLHDGRQFVAKLIGFDDDIDIAVIQIDAKDLTELNLDLDNELQVGDIVLAIGNPFGLGQTVTSGIVSALGRSGLNFQGFQDFIQTDASINPGNSGGPLIDLHGQLVGINTAIMESLGGNIGIGFAIPVNMLRYSIDQLLQHGEVKRGLLGITIQNLTTDLANSFGLEKPDGALITQVIETGPADLAGLLPGDIVRAVNGVVVDTPMQLRNNVGLLPIGSTIELDIIRNTSTRKIKVLIGLPEQKADKTRRLGNLLYGVTLKNMGDIYTAARQFDGAVVFAIVRDCKAWTVGLREYDIIIAANQTPVSTIEDLIPIVDSAVDSLLLHVRRDDKALFMVVK